MCVRDKEGKNIRIYGKEKEGRKKKTGRKGKKEARRNGWRNERKGGKRKMLKGGKKEKKGKGGRK